MPSCIHGEHVYLSTNVDVLVMHWKTGELIRKLNGLSHPQTIFVQDNEIFVVNFRDKVAVFDCATGCLQRCIDINVSDDVFGSPRGVVASGNELSVSFHNDNCIIVFNRDTGATVRTLRHACVKQPWDLALSSRGELVVMCWKHVVVFSHRTIHLDDALWTWDLTPFLKAAVTLMVAAKRSVYQVLRIST